MKRGKGDLVMVKEGGIGGHQEKEQLTATHRPPLCKVKDGLTAKKVERNQGLAGEA